MLGAIPLTLITAYANIVVGDAELTDIPEGYTPHHWEYYKVAKIIKVKLSLTYFKFVIYSIQSQDFSPSIVS